MYLKFHIKVLCMSKHGVHCPGRNAGMQSCRYLMHSMHTWCTNIIHTIMKETASDNAKPFWDQENLSWCHP